MATATSATTTLSTLFFFLFLLSKMFCSPVNMVDIVLAKLVQTGGIVVRLAVDQPVAHAKHVSFGQLGAARDAVEAAQVIDQVARPHHQFVGGDAASAARASLHAEQSATRRIDFFTDAR